MILLHSVDVYQHIHVLWTKYCTELDSLDPLQCNKTVFVGILWISGLSGGFICEFLQFCYCLFGCWWSDKDWLYLLCWLYLKMPYIVRIRRISAFQRYMTCSDFFCCCFCIWRTLPPAGAVYRRRYTGTATGFNSYKSHGLLWWNLLMVFLNPFDFTFLHIYCH